MRNNSIIESARYSDKPDGGFSEQSIIDTKKGTSRAKIEIDTSTPKDRDGKRINGVDYMVITLENVFSKYCEDIDAKWRDGISLYWEFMSDDNKKWRTSNPATPNVKGGAGECDVVFRIPCDKLEQVK